MPSPSVSPWQQAASLEKQVRRQRSRASGGDGFRWESSLSSLLYYLLPLPPCTTRIQLALWQLGLPSCAARSLITVLGAPKRPRPDGSSGAARGKPWERKKLRKMTESTQKGKGLEGWVPQSLLGRDRVPKQKRSPGECHCPVRMKPTSPKRKIPGSAMISLDHWIGSTYKLFSRNEQGSYSGKTNQGGEGPSLSGERAPTHCVHALLSITFSRPLPPKWLPSPLPGKPSTGWRREPLAFWGSQFHVLAEVLVQKDLGLGKRGIEGIYDTTIEILGFILSSW